VRAVFGESHLLGEFVQALFTTSSQSVDIALGLIGALTFWMGLFRVAERAKIIEQLGRLLARPLRALMPGVPKGHPALGSMTLNIAANVLGLDNAATPAGLRAMRDLQKCNPDKARLSDAQMMFVVLNTSSVTLLPVTILMYRAEFGSTQSASVLLPIIIATSCSTLAGVALVACIQKLRIWSFRLCLGIVLYAGLLVSALVLLRQSDNSAGMAHFGNALLITVVMSILGLASFRKQDVYTQFIQGAKSGFAIAIRIIPYLVAMLVAVGLLRASGAFEAVLVSIRTFCTWMNINPAFVDALPTALMKPFSGSGARALMLDTMQVHGVDSTAGRMAAVMQGSTETTFYVLAVYLGAVGIQQSRYLLSVCLAADVVAALAAILITPIAFSLIG